MMKKILKTNQATSPRFTFMIVSNKKGKIVRVTSPLLAKSKGFFPPKLMEEKAKILEELRGIRKAVEK
jgi:hypothetical protein